MLETYQLSEEIRKVLEKQLQLLSEHGADPTGERTMVMLEVVKILSLDEMHNTSIMRVESSRIGELEFELKVAHERICELEAAERQLVFLKRIILIGGVLFLLSFLGGLLFVLL